MGLIPCRWDLEKTAGKKDKDPTLMHFEVLHLPTLTPEYASIHWTADVIQSLPTAFIQVGGSLQLIFSVWQIMFYS